MDNVRQLRPELDQDEFELRKLAVQIAAMLPASLPTALRVLELSREIVTEFLS